MKNSDIVKKFSSGDYNPEETTRAEIMEYIITKQLDPDTYIVWDEGNHIIN